MVSPGGAEEPATNVARRAASVSHDGEAVYAAQLLAAIEMMAFVETNSGEHSSGLPDCAWSHPLNPLQASGLAR